MSEFLSLLPVPDVPALVILALAAVIVAYMVFTLAGFGSALIASAPLALVMPVAKVIPVLALLDCGSSALRGWRARHEVAWGEFKYLFPGMVLGQIIGVWGLVWIPAAWMALVLGGFVGFQGLKGLWPKRPGQTPALPRYPLVRGIFGGILGGLFGSGGFVYAAYLERRLESRSAFRATQAVLIALSTGWRVILCITLGLVDQQTLAIALVLLPVMGAGVLIGQRIDLRMSREQLFRLLNCLLIASGLMLILHHGI